MLGARRFPSLLAATLAISACTPTTVLTPARSLDQPSDVQVVCAQVSPITTGAPVPPTILPLSACDPPDGGFTTDAGVTSSSFPQPFLLITNTNRGELALASTAGFGSTDGGAAVIDLDPKSSGFGFLSIGSLPLVVRATSDGKHAVTANSGSCDLTFIDVGQLIQTAAGATATGPVSEAATRFVPYVGDVPLNAKPTWLEFTIDPQAAGSATPPTVTGKRALVAFPACELVAELDLTATDFTASFQRAQVKQAVKITPSGARVLTADELAALRCPAECGVANEGSGATADMNVSTSDGGDDASVTITDGGVPSTGVGPILPSGQSWPSSFALDLALGGPGRKLAVIGDAVSPRLTFVGISDAGTLTIGSTLTLDGAATGVERVRLSPPINALDNDRFLYVIARDRSVRVVDVDIGTGPQECETNPDNAYLERAGTPIPDLTATLQGAGTVMSQPARPVENALKCLPIGATPRASLATSAGIALPGGALPRDVLFSNTLPTQWPGIIATTTNTATTAPFAGPGTLLGNFAWILDSAGRALAVNLEDDCPAPNLSNVSGTDSPLGCLPKNIPPSLTATAVFPGKPTPRRIDVMPNRLRNGGSLYLTTIVDPGIYATSPGDGAPRLVSLPTVAAAGTTVNFSDPTSVEQSTRLCNPADDGLSDHNQVCGPEPTVDPTVADHPWNFLGFRDPTRVVNETWTVAWEGVIPRTGSSAGTVEGASLLDTSAAFCSKGVEPGDKLLLLGCVDDAGCSPDQLCFLDPQRPPNANGLCINRDPNINNRNMPDPALINPQTGTNACAAWTQTVLRYRIVAIKQTAAGSALTIEELPLPEHAAETRDCNDNSDCAGVLVATTQGQQPINLPTQCLPSAGGRKQCLRACAVAGLPSPDFPGAASANDADCGIGYVCAASAFDARPGARRCLRAPLPPLHNDPLQPGAERCFSNLQSYEVHGGDAFIVAGSSTGFLHSNYPDPTTGACVVPATTSPTRLLRGRIPISVTAGCAPLSGGRKLLDPEPVPVAASMQSNVCVPSGVVPVGEHQYKFENPIFDLIVRVPERIIDASGNTFLDAEGNCTPMQADAGAPCVASGGIADAGALSAVLPPFARTSVPLETTVISFTIIGGFHALGTTLGSDILVQMPRSGVTAPDGTTLYVVDEGKQQAATGLRGQVVRFFTLNQTNDTTFQVR